MNVPIIPKSFLVPDRNALPSPFQCPGNPWPVWLLWIVFCRLILYKWKDTVDILFSLASCTQHKYFVSCPVFSVHISFLFIPVSCSICYIFWSLVITSLGRLFRWRHLILFILCVCCLAHHRPKKYFDLFNGFPKGSQEDSMRGYWFNLTMLQSLCLS